MMVRTTDSLTLFTSCVRIESERSLSEKSIPGFVNVDLPKRVGIKKLSSAIKVGNKLDFLFTFQDNITLGHPNC